MNDTPPRAARTNPPADATPTRVAMYVDPNVANDAGGLIHLAQNRPSRGSRMFLGPGGPTYEQLDRLDAAREEAIALMTRVRARDPAWRPGAVLTNPEDVESDIARYRSWRDDALARLDELGPRGIGDNNPPEPFRIFPNLSGRRAKISERDDPETRRGLYRENESADLIYADGYDVEQSPRVEGRTNPDYLIDGKIFDNYAPMTANLRTIRDTVVKKVETNQAKNIILNLRDSKLTQLDIELLFGINPVEGLEELWIIDRNGKIQYIIGGKRRK